MDINTNDITTLNENSKKIWLDYREKALNILQYTRVLISSISTMMEEIYPVFNDIIFEENINNKMLTTNKNNKKRMKKIYQNLILEFLQHEENLYGIFTLGSVEEQLSRLNNYIGKRESQEVMSTEANKEIVNRAKLLLDKLFERKVIDSSSSIEEKKIYYEYYKKIEEVLKLLNSFSMKKIKKLSSNQYNEKELKELKDTILKISELLEDNRSLELSFARDGLLANLNDINELIDKYLAAKFESDNQPINNKVTEIKRQLKEFMNSKRLSYENLFSLCSALTKQINNFEEIDTYNLYEEFNINEIDVHAIISRSNQIVAKFLELSDFLGKLIGNKIADVDSEANDIILSSLNKCSAIVMQIIQNSNICSLDAALFLKDDEAVEYCIKKRGLFTDNKINTEASNSNYGKSNIPIDIKRVILEFQANNPILNYSVELGNNLLESIKEKCNLINSGYYQIYSSMLNDLIEEIHNFTMDIDIPSDLWKRYIKSYQDIMNFLDISKGNGISGKICDYINDNSNKISEELRKDMLLFYLEISGLVSLSRKYSLSDDRINDFVRKNKIDIDIKTWQKFYEYCLELYNSAIVDDGHYVHESDARFIKFYFIDVMSKLGVNIPNKDDLRNYEFCVERKYSTYYDFNEGDEIEHHHILNDVLMVDYLRKITDQHLRMAEEIVADTDELKIFVNSNKNKIHRLSQAIDVISLVKCSAEMEYKIQLAVVEFNNDLLKICGDEEFMKRLNDYRDDMYTAARDSSSTISLYDKEKENKKLMDIISAFEDKWGMGSFAKNIITSGSSYLRENGINIGDFIYAFIKYAHMLGKLSYQEYIECHQITEEYLEYDMNPSPEKRVYSFSAGYHTQR